MHNSVGNSTLLLFNSRSVKNKWCDIVNVMDMYDAGIVAITETWLSCDTDCDAYTHREFSKFVSHRQDGSGYGGVMCLLRHEYDAVELTKPSSLPTTCDCLVLHLRSLSSVLVTLYRPPSCTVSDTASLITGLEEILALGHHTTIMGDFNFPKIDWLADPPTADNDVSNAFVEMCAAWNLTQIVPGPTRGANWLDLLLTTTTSAYCNCRVEPPVCTSDHQLVVCQFTSPRIKPKSGMTNKQIDYAALQQWLEGVNWTQLYANSTDVDRMWGVFQATIVNAIDNCSFNATARPKHRPRRIRTLFLRKRRRWRLWQRKPTPKNKARLDYATERLSTAIKQNRKRSEEKLLQEPASRFFHHVSSRLQHCEHKIALKDISGDYITSDTGICDALATEFAKNFSAPSTASVVIGSTEDSAFQMDLTLDALLSVIRDMPNTAAGPDGIPATVYKRLTGYIVHPLLAIFRQSIMQGKLPQSWKIAKIIALYKGKGDVAAPSSYRPISLTCVACKILERMIVRSLDAYLETKAMLIDGCQHGFRHGKSTVTNLLECDTLIANYLNSDTACDVVCFDFSKAFDKVDHGLLCNKLKSAGIDGCYLRWMVDYLSNREQFISYKDARSAMFPVTSGVIQGSAIGPSFFMLYINDLCKVIKNSKSSLFADDLKVVADVSTPQRCKLAQEDVNSVANWSAENKLPINFDKCVSVHYGRANLRYQYIIQQHKIRAEHCITDLGVCRSDTFTYDEHVRNTVLKTARKAGMVLKVFRTRDAEFLKRVFISYIRPSLEYASSVWSSSGVSLNASLERVQRRYTKRICGLKDVPYEQRLCVLGLSTLAKRRLYHDLVLTYKCLHGILAVSHQSLGLQLSQAPTRAGGLRLVHYKPKSKIIAQCFQSRIPPLWNNLPLSVVSCRTLRTFKAALAKHLHIV